MEKGIKIICSILLLTSICNSTEAQYNQFYTPNVNFSTYKPQPLQFESPDNSITQRSLRQFEERQNWAFERVLEFNNYVSEISPQLSPDEETQHWFKNLYNDYTNRIKERSNCGDYGGAGRLAMEFTSELMNSNELRARIRSWEEYKEKVMQYLNDNEIRDITKQRWIELNPYTFKPTYDSKGKVLSYKPFQLSGKFGLLNQYPLKPINWEETVSLFIGNQNSSFSAVRNAVFSYIKLNEIMRAEQEYEDMKYMYDKIKSEYISQSFPVSTPKSDELLETLEILKTIILSPSGSYITLDEFITKVVESFLHRFGLKDAAPANVQKTVKSTTSYPRKSSNSGKRRGYKRKR